MEWILVIAAIVVAFAFLKVRRQRKSRDSRGR
jgi:preprotein translocase subunit YajC